MKRYHCAYCDAHKLASEFYVDSRPGRTVQYPCIACKKLKGWHKEVLRRLEIVWVWPELRTHKICVSCEKDLPIDDFAFNIRRRTNPEGRTGQCRSCLGERIAARYAAKVAADPEGIHAKQAAHRNANPEKQRQYRRAWENNARDKVRAKVLRRRAKIANAPFVEDVSLDVIFIRDKGICSLCFTKVKRKEASVDHIIPLSKGGEHSYKNCALAHNRCNAKKNNKPVLQQLRLLG